MGMLRKKRVEPCGASKEGERVLGSAGVFDVVIDVAFVIEEDRCERELREVVELLQGAADADVDWSIGDVTHDGLILQSFTKGRRVRQEIHETSLVDRSVAPLSC